MQAGGCGLKHACILDRGVFDMIMIEARVAS